MKRILLCTLVLGHLTTARLEASPVIGVNFTGTQLNAVGALNGGSTVIPPDSMGAIGPGQFAEFTNGSFAVYNSTSGTIIGSRIGLTSFWQNLGITGLSTSGTVATDPHIIYDPGSARWYAVAIDLPSGGASAPTNRFLIAVSNTSDATAGWSGFSTATSATANQFGDFPMLGMNGDALVIGVNNSSNSTGNSVSSSFLIVPKSGLLAATPTIANATLLDNVSSTLTGSSSHPAIDMQNGSGSIVLLSDFNTSGGQLKRSDIKATNTVSPVLDSSKAPISVAAFAAPSTAAQPGGPNTLDTSDSRFSGNVVEQNGHIWAVQNVETSTGHAGLRWVRINASNNALEASGTVGDSSSDDYYGSIAVNTSGQIVIGYTQSSSTQAPSAYAQTGLYAGANTTFDSPTLLKQGTGNYNLTFGSPTNAWGLYSSTTLDPSNPSVFWTIQEYVNGTNNWATEISQISVPEPSWSGLVMLGILGLTLHRPRTHHRPAVINA